MSTVSAADAVLSDALREAGYERLTPWHLRCVEAYLAQQETLETVHWQDRYDLIHERLGYDIANTLDELHLKAQWDDAQWVARHPTARARGDR